MNVSMARPIRLTRPKLAKYRSKRTVIDGHSFASKKEMRRYGELKLLEGAGEISRLWYQHRLPIHVCGELVCTYVADFTYEQAGKSVIEDCKGFRTPVFKLKKRLVKAVYGIEILET